MCPGLAMHEASHGAPSQSPFAGESGDVLRACVELCANGYNVLLGEKGTTILCALSAWMVLLALCFPQLPSRLWHFYVTPGQAPCYGVDRATSNPRKCFEYGVDTLPEDVVSMSDGNDVVIRELRLRTILSVLHELSSVSDVVLHRHVLEIAFAIVRPYTIHVIDMEADRTRSYKCLHDKGMDSSLYDRWGTLPTWIFLDKRDTYITSVFHALQYLTGPSVTPCLFSTNTPLIRDRVESLESDNWKPLLIREVAHAC